MSSVLDLRSFSGQGDTAATKFFSPLNITASFTVRKRIPSPTWRLHFESDVASEKATVDLLHVSPEIPRPPESFACTAASSSPGSEGDELVPGVLYEVCFHVDDMQEKLSTIKEKYLQQVSIVRIQLCSHEGILLDECKIVCQAVRMPYEIGRFTFGWRAAILIHVLNHVPQRACFDNPRSFPLSADPFWWVNSLEAALVGPMILLVSAAPPFIMFLGGFVPRRFAQFNRDPCWMFFIFSVGVWLGEYPAMQIKYNARDLVLDPHRYICVRTVVVVIAVGRKLRGLIYSREGHRVSVQKVAFLVAFISSTVLVVLVILVSHMSDSSQNRKRLRSCDPNELVDPNPVKGRVDPSRPPSWQLASSRRCVACGKISCGCRVQVDPELKRMRLEQLQRNTPYARAKILRCTEELREQEKTKRAELENNWMLDRLKLEASCVGLKDVVQLFTTEEVARSDILRTENQNRELISRIMQTEKNTVYCVICEINARRALVAEEKASRLHLEAPRAFLRRAQAVLVQQSQLREELALQEASDRAMLRTLVSDGVHLLHAQQLEVQHLVQQFHAGREGLLSQWDSGLSGLKESWVRLAHLLHAQEEERVHRGTRFFHQLGDIVKEESVARQGLLRLMRSEEALIEEKLANERTEQVRLRREEHEYRSRILQEGLEEWDRLFHEMQKSEATARMRESERQRLLEEEMDQCFQCKERICCEEAEAFLQFLRTEAMERDACIQRVKDHIFRCASFAAACVQTKCDVIEQEEKERKCIRNDFFAEYERCIHWLGVKQKQIGACLVEEDELRMLIVKKEHDDFFYLYNRKSEEEVLVHRMSERKVAEQDAVRRDETRLRKQLIIMEENCRETIFLQYARAEEERLASLTHWKHCASMVEQRFVSQRASMIEDEVSQRSDMEAQFLEQFRHLVQIEFFKSLCSVDVDEARHRSAVSQSEATAWGHLMSLCSVAQLSHLELLAARFDADAKALEETERFSRDSLAAQEGRVFTHILRRECEERDDAQRADAANLAAQRRLEEIQREDDSIAGLRQNLVRQALKMDEEVSLGYSQVLYLSQVVDIAINYRSELQASTDRAAAAAEEASRRLERMERTLEEKREQRERGSDLTPDLNYSISLDVTTDLFLIPITLYIINISPTTTLSNTSGAEYSIAETLFRSLFFSSLSVLMLRFFVS
eukprot:gene8651-6078_t